MRDELEGEGEKEPTKWATSESATDDAMYAAYWRSHVNLVRIKRENQKQAVEKENSLYATACSTSVLSKIILGGLHVVPMGSCMRLCHPSSTYRNSKCAFGWVHDITNPTTRSQEFHEGHVWVLWVHVHSKKLSVMRQRPYGVTGDDIEEYTVITFPTIARSTLFFGGAYCC